MKTGDLSELSDLVPGIVEAAGEAEVGMIIDLINQVIVGEVIQQNWDIAL